MFARSSALPLPSNTTIPRSFFLHDGLSTCFYAVKKLCPGPRIENVVLNSRTTWTILKLKDCHVAAAPLHYRRITAGRFQAYTDNLKTFAFYAMLSTRIVRRSCHTTTTITTPFRSICTGLLVYTATTIHSCSKSEVLRVIRCCLQGTVCVFSVFGTCIWIIPGIINSYPTDRACGRS